VADSSSNSSLVVATVTTTADLDLLQNQGCPEGIDVLEFRLDNLADQLERTREIALSVPKALITARCQAEGGVHPYADDAERVAALEPFAGQAAFIDIEVASLESSAELREFGAALAGTSTQLVASFHDFQATPPLGRLWERLEQASQLGADIFKAALYLEEMSMLFALVEMIEAAEKPVSLMGMGPLGKLSRLVLAREGSVLNYGYLQESNAPGQWPATELKRLIGEIA